MRLVFAVALFASVCRGQTPPRPAAPSPVTVQEVIAWLPADTETVEVVNFRSTVPKLKSPKDDEKNRKVASHQLRELGILLALSRFGALDNWVLNILRGATLILAVDGSRHFRPPGGLGQRLVEGCGIAMFAEDLTERGDRFFKEAAAKSLKTREIEGVRVVVAQEKFEQDLLTFYMAFPRRSVVISATNEGYLREVLRRMQGGAGPRALPLTLPEWKYLAPDAPAWALRHYDRSQAELDPSSPFGGSHSANNPDEDAIGIVFQLDADDTGRARTTYLTGASNALEFVRKSFFPSDYEPETTKDMRIEYRELSPGVVESSYWLTHTDTVSLFMFILEGLLGHAVYV